MCLAQQVQEGAARPRGGGGGPQTPLPPPPPPTASYGSELTHLFGCFLRLMATRLLHWKERSTPMLRENRKNGNIPCRLLFSRSILIRRICSMIAFRHKALSSLADLLHLTIWDQDVLWGITPNSESVSKKNKTSTQQINITHSCCGVFSQW